MRKYNKILIGIGVVIVVLLIGIGIYFLVRKESFSLFGETPIEIHTDDPMSPHIPTQHNLMNTILVSQLSPAAQQEMAVSIKVAPAKLDLPKHFDCREKWPKWISKPLNQGTCGSCWAFSTSTAASDRLRIASNGRSLMTPIVYYLHYQGQIIKVPTIDTLSPYHLAACNNCEMIEKLGNVAFAKWMLDNNECNHECNGGIIPYAFNFISKFGITSMACEYRKKGHRERYICQPDVDCDFYKGQTSDPKKDVNQLVGVDAIKHSIMMHGPVVGGFTVYNSFMTFFTGANIKKAYPSLSQIADGSWKDGVAGQHAIALIGWSSDETGREFWIIRNSWSEKWGDNGYFRMYIGVSNVEQGTYEILM